MQNWSEKHFGAVDEFAYHIIYHSSFAFAVRMMVLGQSRNFVAMAYIAAIILYNAMKCTVIILLLGFTAVEEPS